MPELDAVSQSIGELKATCKIIQQSVDEIRINLVTRVETNEKNLRVVMPLVPTLQDIATARKVGKWGIRTAILLGSCNFLPDRWTVGIKNMIANATGIHGQ